MESGSDQVEALRQEMKQMRLERKQEKMEMKEMILQKEEEMRIKLEEMRNQREEEEKEEMRLQREQKEEEMRMKFEEEKSDLILKLNAVTKKVERLEAELSRDLPFVVSCAYQDYWVKAYSVITYGRHIVEFNNGYRPGGAEGVINLESGRFTVGP